MVTSEEGYERLLVFNTALVKDSIRILTPPRPSRGGTVLAPSRSILSLVNVPSRLS